MEGPSSDGESPSGWWEAVQRERCGAVDFLDEEKEPLDVEAEAEAEEELEWEEEVEEEVEEARGMVLLMAGRGAVGRMTARAFADASNAKAKFAQPGVPSSAAFWLHLQKALVAVFGHGAVLGRNGTSSSGRNVTIRSTTTAMDEVIRLHPADPFGQG